MFKKSCLLILFFGATSTVYADTYLNIGASMNTVKSKENITATHTTNHDEDSTKAYFDFGYFFTENFAAEIGYRSAEGKERYSFSGSPLEGETKVDVLKIGIKAFTSTEDDLYGFGGLGLAMMDVETTITDATASQNFSNGDKVKDDTNNLYYTVGAGYRFTETLSAEIAYANYGKAGDAGENITKPSEQKYSEISLGISYRF